MERKERLEQIKNQIRAIQTPVGGPDPRAVAHDAMVVGEAHAEKFTGGYVGTTPNNIPVDEIRFLVEEVERLQAINESLVHINRELAQEIENVKADFGSNQR